MATVSYTTSWDTTQLRIDKMTVWRWRMRLLRALLGDGEIRARRLEGIVEVAEKFFRESRKGSREWVDHERDPARHPKPDRPRWRDFRRLRRLFPAGLSRWQIPVLTPVLTMTDRAGGNRADVTYLTHCSSFQLNGKMMTSNDGTEQPSASALGKGIHPPHATSCMGTPVDRRHLPRDSPERPQRLGRDRRRCRQS